MTELINRTTTATSAPGESPRRRQVPASVPTRTSPAHAASAHAASTQRAARVPVPARAVSPGASLFDATKRDASADVVVAVAPSAATDIADANEAFVAARRKPPTRVLMAARLASVGAAACVLCGSLAAAAIISEHRAASNAPVTPQPNLEITGVAALSPDVLAANTPNGTLRDAPRSMAPRAGSDAAAAPGTAPAGSATTELPVAPTQRPVAPPAQVGADTPSLAPVVPDARTGLVEQFYGLIVTRPVDAFRLLSGDLSALGLIDFLNSWGRVTAIDVLDVRALPGREVIATVQMLLSDGSVLRVQQLLTVADQGRIVGARLLSTQRG